MIKRIAKTFGYVPAPKRGNRKLRARFDSAGTDDETRRHWARADSLAADAAANPAVRAILRVRGRHEQFNNAYVFGPLHTLGNDIIGIGPSLQMLTPNETVNQAVEEKFNDWAEASGLAETLRLMRRTRAAAGEVLLVMVRNPGIDNPVKLGLKLIEGDQLATPMRPIDRSNRVDGIEFDADDNPVWYHVLKRHPGATNIVNLSPLDFDRVPAVNVVHFFRPERPGQRRGIPEITPALNLHASRRGYRQAVLAAAKRLAELGAIFLKTEGDGDTEDVPDPFETLEVEHGVMTALPPGTEPFQAKAEQPATTYAEFDDRIISEQARPLNMPYGIAAGNSSKYNFASVKFDAQVFDRSNDIDREEMARLILRPIFRRWAIMATAIPNYLPRRATQVYLPTSHDPLFQPRYRWHWRDREHVDPSKASNAQAKQLGNHTTTLSDEYATKRKDWRVQIDQAGREHEALTAADIAWIDPAFAPQIVEVLEQVPRIGVEAAVEILTLMKVARPKAKRLAELAKQAKPKSVSPQVSGNGQVSDDDDDDLPASVRKRVNGNGVVPR